MNFDSQPPLKKQEKPPRKETSLQLRLAAGLECWLFSKEISVEGLENLKLIPPEAKVLIASSHISDLDMLLAIKALGKHLDIAVTGKSTNINFKEDPIATLSTSIAGLRNFLPIDYKDKTSKNAGVFNPDNYVNMAKSAEKGKAILMAAHNPSVGALPEKGGKGVAYLAQVLSKLGEYVILPVASDYQSSEPYKAGVNDGKMIKERASSKVIIGKPIILPKIEEFEEFEKLSEKRFNGEKFTSEESEKFENIQEKLKVLSDIVMKTIASMLPEEKRGSYSE